jgi:hypothetical protein
LQFELIQESSVSTKITSGKAYDLAGQCEWNPIVDDPTYWERNYIPPAYNFDPDEDQIIRHNIENGLRLQPSPTRSLAVHYLVEFVNKGVVKSGELPEIGKKFRALREDFATSLNDHDVMLKTIWEVWKQEDCSPISLPDQGLIFSRKSGVEIVR